MKKHVLAIASLIFCAGLAQAAPATIAPSSNEMDFGIVAGAFAGRPKIVVAGNYTYNIIAPDLVEPACNSTQIVLWVEDDTLEGEARGVAYNLGVQASKLVSVNASGDELQIVYRVNNIDDCSTSTDVTKFVKYTGSGECT